MVSVAMCTYNGERYLTEQLESIAAQSHPVGELVVCDDRSNDGTIGILEEFAKKSPFKVSIHINETNLGSTKNFEKCLRLCEGDILVLCDQDDVWEKDKVQQQVDFFNGHPEFDAVFSNAYLIDGHGKRLDHRLWDNFGFGAERKELWNSGKANEVLFESYVVTGATLALRKTALRFLAPFPTHLGPYIHDAWMALVLAVQNKIGFIDDELLSYRVHASQQVGFGKKQSPVTLKDRWMRSRDDKTGPIRQRAELLKDLVLALEQVKGVSAESLLKLKELQAHFQARAALPPNRFQRIAPAFSELFKGRYTFSSRHWWLPFFGDLLE